MGIIFDLEKAYDTTWRYGVLRALQTTGLRGHLPLFLRSFLQERTFSVSVDTVISPSFEQKEGVPQGSVLSVTLFSVAINIITKYVLHDFRCTVYADEFLLIYASFRFRVAERHIQLALGRVTRWADSHGFKFSPTKTVTMLFSRDKSEFRDLDLYLYGRRLPVVETTRFLGLVFDRHIT